MYKLPYFTEDDHSKVLAFMNEYPFAAVTGYGEDYPVATQLPLNIETRADKLLLTGHLMKNTDHHRAFEKNENVLVIFNGPHTYISASWYRKQDVASTWNYISVHAKGKIRFTNREGTYRAIQSITDKYEGKVSPAAFSCLSEEYVSGLLNAIVGFEIEVMSLDNVFKLSQNHHEETRISITEQLIKRGDENSLAIAKEMRKRMENE